MRERYFEFTYWTYLSGLKVLDIPGWPALTHATSVTLSSRMPLDFIAQESDNDGPLRNYCNLKRNSMVHHLHPKPPGLGCKRRLCEELPLEDLLIMSLVVAVLQKRLNVPESFLLNATDVLPQSTDSSSLGAHDGDQLPVLGGGCQQSSPAIGCHKIERWKGRQRRQVSESDACNGAA